MKQTLILKSPEVVERVCHILRGLGFVEPHEVVIRPHKKDRSAAQQGLQWLWYTVIGGELGETKEAVHERYKERFMVPIFTRDDPEYAAMVEAVRAVHRQGMKTESLALKNKIVALTSTTAANTSQMAEYLTEIDRDAASLGIILPRPEDRYWEAMG